MKFKILRSKFIEGLKTVQNVASDKSTLAILENVKIEAKGGKLTLTTSDLEMTIRCKIDCEIEEEGETTQPVKLLFNAMMKAPECEIIVTVDEKEQAVVQASSSRLRLNGKPANEYPELKLEEDTDIYTLPRKVFFEMIRKTCYAASQDDTRRTLKGELFSFKNGKLTVVATDGRRLAMVEQEVEFAKTSERDIVLPINTVLELQRLLDGEGDLTIHVQRSKICFLFGDVELYAKLVADVYPNYLQVIPSECSETIIVDRQMLLNALERASVMTIDEAHSIKLIFSGNMLTVTSVSSDKGDAKDEVPIKYMGEEIEIIFNPNYVMDPLKVIDDDEVTINLTNGHSPAIIRCSIPFLYVLMPLRIS